MDGLAVSCIVGVWPHERDEAQPVVVDLAFELDVRRASSSEDLTHSVDYARATSLVTFVLQEGHFLLLESAAEVLCAALLRSFAAADAVVVTIRKPRALGGAGIPSLTIRRARDVDDATTPGTGRAVLWHGREATVLQLHLAPRARMAWEGSGTFACFDEGRGRTGERLVVRGNSFAAHDDGATLLAIVRPPLRDDAHLVIEEP